jgi:hypothetical protein
VEHPDNLVEHPDNLVEHPDNLVEHPDNLVEHPDNLVEHPDNLVDLFHPLEFLANLPEHLSTSLHLVGSTMSRLQLVLDMFHPPVEHLITNHQQVALVHYHLVQ